MVTTLKKMKTDEKKTQEQRKALNAWAKANYTGSIIAGTGFGKSRCGVAAIHHTLKNNPKATGLILVPTTQLKDQFIEEFYKWNFDAVLEQVEIMCYHSAYKLMHEHYDIVVCDEIHLGLSTEYRKFFEQNSYDRLLCMTATLPEEIEYNLKLQALAPIIYTITLDECVDLGLVAPYEIYCIPIELTEQERANYTTINQEFVKHKIHLGPDAFNIAKACIGNNSAHPIDRMHAAGFYKAIRDRKSIVDTADNKIEKFKDIVYTNLNKKIISFGGKNSFTSKLAESVSPYAVTYHSGITPKKRAEALKRFTEGKINVICSTKSLNQGFDAPGASIGIVCGLTSKSLSMIQRVGRLLRYKEGKIGKIYIIYVKDSQEEKWLKSSVKTLKNVKWLTQ